MTLKEAIEILTEEQKDHHSFPTDLIGKAELLCIEAGKTINETRQFYKNYYFALLPGETEH